MIKHLLLFSFVATTAFAEAPQYHHTPAILNDEIEKIYRLLNSGVDVVLDPLDISSGSIDDLQVQTINGSWPNPNILINGDMEIWQRNLSSANILSGQYGADRWQFVKSGTVTGTVSRESVFVDTGTYSQKLIISGVSGAATAYVKQQVEDFSYFRAKSVSLSVRVNCNTSNTIKISINDSVGSSTSSYAACTSAWETLTVSRTIASGASSVDIRLGALSSDASNTTSYFDAVMFVIGNQAIQFIPRSFGYELSLAQRYFEKSYEVDTPPGSDVSGTGNNRYGVSFAQTGATQMTSFIPFKVTKRSMPTITFYRETGVSGSWVFSNTSGAQANRTVGGDGTTSTAGIPIRQNTAVEYHGFGHWTADSEM